MAPEPPASEAAQAPNPRLFFVGLHLWLLTGLDQNGGGSAIRKLQKRLVNLVLNLGKSSRVSGESIQPLLLLGLYLRVDFARSHP